MHILGIVGSSRVNGNTDVLVDEVLAGVRSAGGTIDKIYLSDFDIKPCNSCMACLADQKCVVEDQMAEIYEKVGKAEGLVLGTPVYWNCVSGQMKIFIDRCFAFLNENYESKLAGKSGACVVACGAKETQMLEISRTVIVDFFKFNNVSCVGEVLGTGLSEKNDALKRHDLMAAAFQLGRKFI